MDIEFAGVGLQVVADDSVHFKPTSESIWTAIYENFGRSFEEEFFHEQGLFVQEDSCSFPETILSSQETSFDSENTRQSLVITSPKETNELSSSIDVLSPARSRDETSELYSSIDISSPTRSPGNEPAPCVREHTIAPFPSGLPSEDSQSCSLKIKRHRHNVFDQKFHAMLSNGLVEELDGEEKANACRTLDINHLDNVFVVRNTDFEQIFRFINPQNPIKKNSLLKNYRNWGFKAVPDTDGRDQYKLNRSAPLQYIVTEKPKKRKAIAIELGL